MPTLKLAKIKLLLTTTILVLAEVTFYWQAGNFRLSSHLLEFNIRNLIMFYCYFLDYLLMNVLSISIFLVYCNSMSTACANYILNMAMSVSYGKRALWLRCMGDEGGDWWCISGH